MTMLGFYLVVNSTDQYKTNFFGSFTFYLFPILTFGEKGYLVENLF